nr:protein furry homolog-like [Tanacetum cinerariifolium]
MDDSIEDPITSSHLAGFGFVQSGIPRFSYNRRRASRTRTAQGSVRWLRLTLIYQQAICSSKVAFFMELDTRRIDTSGARSETLSIINGMRYLKLEVKTEGGLNASVSLMAKANPLNRAPHKRKSELRHTLCNMLSNILAPLADGGKGDWPPPGVHPALNLLSAGCTPGGGQSPFPPSASGAKMFDSILQSAWRSSLFRLWGAQFRGLAFATRETKAFRPPSVLTCQKVAHSINDTECFTSSTTGINPTSIEFYEKCSVIELNLLRD